MLVRSLLLTYLFLALPSTNAQGGAMKNLLIVYGSQKGSTAEIATKMKEYLHEADFAVDVMPASASKIDLAKYDLVIIGSGIYGGKPHKDIAPFIDNNRASLGQKKVAVFAVCGKMCSPNEKARNEAMAFSGKVACGLTPAGQTVFAGKMASSGWLGNGILKLMWGAQPGDHRDWEKIKAWTLSLGELILKGRE
jgi:menaquinone-dependent protoporphyrinogen oxidase